MRAIVLREHGGPEVLRLEEVPTPEPGPGEVLIQVHAVSVNRTLDLTVRQGGYPRGCTLPLVLGVDPSGVVSRVGVGVDPAWVGNRVAAVYGAPCNVCPPCLAGQETECTERALLGLHRWGGYAEYVVVPATQITRIPDNLSFADATVIVRHFPTAFQLLETKAGLKPGEWVLIMGAAGALGSCGVQVAKYLGGIVIAGAGADERVAAAMSYGADYGVNYRAQDLEREVLRITGGRGVGVVFENIADPSLWPGAFNSLATNGRLVTAGAHGGGKVTLDVQRLYLRRLRVIGSPGSQWRDVDNALRGAAEGRLRAIIGCVLPLSQTAKAHRLLEANVVIGKIILDPTLG